MPILNAKNSNFLLKFPPNFLYPEVVEKYQRYLIHDPNPYDTLVDYLNASIQSVNFTGFSYTPNQQVLLDDFVGWKSGFDANKMLVKTFTVNFKTYEGFINYWIMREQLTQFLDYDTENEFLSPITLSFLDHVGFELVNYKFEQVLMVGIGDLDLSFSNNMPNFETFSIDFTYNYLKIQHRLD